MGAEQRPGKASVRSPLAAPARRTSKPPDASKAAPITA